MAYRDQKTQSWETAEFWLLFIGQDVVFGGADGTAKATAIVEIEDGTKILFSGRYPDRLNNFNSVNIFSTISTLLYSNTILKTKALLFVFRFAHLGHEMEVHVHQVMTTNWSISIHHTWLRVTDFSAI